MKRYLAGGNHNRKNGFQRRRLGRYRSEKTRRGNQQQPHKGSKSSGPEREHKTANREVRKRVKTDKRDFVEGLAEEAERATASRNMKQLYDTTKKLA